MYVEFMVTSVCPLGVLINLVTLPRLLFQYRLTMLFALFKDCNTPLSAEKGGSGCYPLDNHLLCQDCNAVRVQKMTAELDSKPARPLTTEL